MYLEPMPPAPVGVIVRFASGAKTPIVKKSSPP
jgi:hypothetical protein